MCSAIIDSHNADYKWVKSAVYPFRFFQYLYYYILFLQLNVLRTNRFYDLRLVASQWLFLCSAGCIFTPNALPTEWTYRRGLWWTAAARITPSQPIVNAALAPGGCTRATIHKRPTTWETHMPSTTPGKTKWPKVPFIKNLWMFFFQFYFTSLTSANLRWKRRKKPHFTSTSKAVFLYFRGLCACVCVCNSETERVSVVCNVSR